MTKKDIADILLPVAYGFIERQFMPDLEQKTYESWNPEVQKLFVAFGDFVSVNPTNNRLAALIRSVGRYEYWKNFKVEEFVKGSVEEAINVIIEMAKEFEMKQSFMKMPPFSRTGPSA